VILLSLPAERQLDALVAHSEPLARPAATRNILAAVQTASDRIEAGAAGLPAPTPYPETARRGLGFRWIKQGAYWFAFAREGSKLIITGIFYETADIPNRL
jgi:plasmid stabilization system protein ParE